MDRIEEERVDGAIRSRALDQLAERGRATEKTKKKEERNKQRRRSSNDDDEGKVSPSSSVSNIAIAVPLAIPKTRSERTHALPYICSVVVCSEKKLGPYALADGHGWRARESACPDALTLLTAHTHDAFLACSSGAGTYIY
jgi:hypothetical protein